MLIAKYRRVTSLSTGTIYAIASYQRNIPIMVASLPGRLLAGFCIFIGTAVLGLGLQSSRFVWGW
jgi:hypothetical protein